MGSDATKGKVPFGLKVGIAIAAVVIWVMYSNEQDRIKAANSANESRIYRERQAKLLAEAVLLPPAYRFQLDVEGGDEDTPPNIKVTLDTFKIYPNGTLDMPCFNGKLDKNLCVSDEDFVFDLAESGWAGEKGVNPGDLVHQILAIDRAIMYAKRDLAKLKKKHQLSAKEQLLMKALEEALENDFVAYERLPTGRGFAFLTLKIPLEKAVRPS